MSALAASVTHAAKAAVWRALAQSWHSHQQIGAALGLDWLLVAEIVGQARDKGLVEIDDRDRQAVRITRRGAAA